MKALRLKTHHFHTKLPYQRPMLRQIKWWLQNEPVKKNGVLPASTSFFWKFCSSIRTSIKTWLVVPANQMPLFVLFVSAGVSFDGALWVSLNLNQSKCEIFVVNSLNYWFFKRFLLINLVDFFTQIDTRIRCSICILSIFNCLVFLRVKIFYS